MIRLGSRALALVAVLALAVPRHAHADARSEARRHYQRGMSLAEHGQYDASIDELRTAYEILPHPNVLYNMARACALAGRLEEARRYFGQYLDSDPPDREEVQLILAELEAAELETMTSAQDSSAVETPPATPRGATPAENAERVATLRASARELRATADALDSVVLREQAARLEAAADALERADASAASSAAPTPADEAATSSAASTESSTSVETQEPERAAALDTMESAERRRSTTVIDATYESSVVSASRSTLSPLDAPVSVEVITRQDIRLSGVTQIAEIVRRAAGTNVITPTPFDSNVSIRGFGRLFGPRLIMLVNGRSTYFDMMGYTFWGVQPFAVEDIERIEVIRGPASTIYGANGFTGVVNVILRAPGVDRGAEFHTGVGNAGQFRVVTSYSGRSERISYRAQAGYAQSDLFTLPYARGRVDLPRAEHDLASGGRMVHGSGQLHVRLNDRVNLEFEGGTVYATNVAYVGAAGMDLGQMSAPHSFAMATARHGWGVARASWNRTVGEPTSYITRFGPFDITLDILNVENDFHRRFRFLAIDHDLHVGAAYRFKRLDAPLIGGTNLEHHFAAYVEDNLRFTDTIRGVAALRMDRHPLLDRPVFSPRIGLIVRPHPDRAIRLTTSTAFRTPSMVDTYAHFASPTGLHAVDGVALGTVFTQRSPTPTSTEAERIVTVEAGYVDQHFDALNFELNAYFNEVRGLLDLAPVPHRFTVADYANPEFADLTAFDTTRNAFLGGYSALRASPGRYHGLGGEAILRSNPLDGLDLSLGYAVNYTFVDHSDFSESRDRRAPLHSVHAGVQYRSPVGVDASVDLFYNGETVWPELRPVPAGVTRSDLTLAAYAFANARVAYRMLADRLELAVAGTYLSYRRFRTHPLGQAIGPRVMATASLRF